MSISSPPPVTDAEHFTQLHNEFRRPVESYIVNRLPGRDRHLAEDIASEVFTSLWKTYYAQGRTIDGKPWGLLATIAKRRMCDHFRLSRNTREWTTDASSWQFENQPLKPDKSGAWSR
ncbi:sigma factor [Streptomyces sp. BE308]|uniref:RNA polymerase sigma factor n=1 Tax=Streptomyces sp. BE308 TaxID=3002529 RepID=UPI002E76B3FF|nr:sigma factor [Streptomyces sp. BE308]MEE1796421.1 sigma factor [Streptomyces sp. BE308]